MKVSTKKHRATIFQCILSSRETFGEVDPKILLNAPLCGGLVTSTPQYTAHCTALYGHHCSYEKKYFFLIFFEDNFLNLVILCKETKSQIFWIKIDRVKKISKSRNAKNHDRGGF